MVNLLLICLFALLLLFSTYSIRAGADGLIGVNYGMMGDNLPSPSQVIDMYLSHNISRLRLYAPNADAFGALQVTGIDVVLGTLNADLPNLANDPSFAASWVQTNVAPYAVQQEVKFRAITVGNEVIPGDLASYVAPAMGNLDQALADAGLSIPVSTAVPMSVIGDAPMPSQGFFSDAASPYITDVVSFLQSKNYPLFLNAYPFFAYDPAVMQLAYALLNSTEVIVHDGDLGYTNILHAMVDTVYTALEKVGADDVEVVVSETGWPSGGGPETATVEYAQTYNNAVVTMAINRQGTPKRPGRGLEMYVFAMFNEDQKSAGVEQHFGLFNPDMTEVYHIDWPN